MKKENGVTLLILAISVVIMIILTGAAINYGYNSLQATRLRNFTYEIEQVQGKVDTIYEKIKMGDNSYISLGANITESERALNTLKTVKNIDYSNLTEAQREEYYYQNTITTYRYISESNAKKYFDISSNPGDLIINFLTREVISVDGFNYKEMTYYRLYEIYDGSRMLGQVQSSESLSKSYPKSGLILRYDGIQNTLTGHNNATTVWKDISGNGRDGELQNFSFQEGSQWTSNGLTFDGENDGVWVGDKLKDMWKSDVYIEMTLNFNEASTRDILFGNHASSNAINIEKLRTNDLRFYWNAGKADLRYPGSVFEKANTPMTVGIALDKTAKTATAYINGEKFQTLASDYYTDNVDYNNGWIGRDSRTGETVLNGTIYAVRIYNRLLTEDEISSNYILDKERFEL